MPPLCTSGYGLATVQMKFFIGAFYLYMINCVYIGLATWIGVRILKIPKKTFVDSVRRKKILRGVTFIVLITALPSVYITYKILKDNILQNQVNSFVSQQFNFTATQVIRKQLVSGKAGQEILEITLDGERSEERSVG